MVYTPDFLLLNTVVLKPRQQQLLIGALSLGHPARTATIPTASSGIIVVVVVVIVELLMY